MQAQAAKTDLAAQAAALIELRRKLVAAPMTKSGRHLNGNNVSGATRACLRRLEAAGETRDHAITSMWEVVREVEATRRAAA